MIKLSVYGFYARSCEDEHMTVLAEDAMSKVRQIDKGNIRADISFSARADMGLTND